MKSLRAWVLLAALPLAGCGALQGIDAGDGTTAVTELRGGDTEPAKVLAHYARARQLAGPELAREQEAARRALARTKSDANRVRYALLLTLAPAGEEARTLELLEPVTRNGESALRGLALLMTALLQEQRRLDANAQGLQQKLDALLTLERSMTGREGGAARKK